jgi:hypothetical protein
VLCVSVLASALWYSSAFASEEPTNRQLLQLIEALQARVAVLEQQLSRDHHQLAKVEGHSQPIQLAAYHLEPSAEPAPMRLAGSGGNSVVPEVTVPTWTGIYWGTSFGGAGTNGEVSSSETYTARFPTNSFPNNVDGSVFKAQSKGDGDGALIDLFLGVNQQVGSRWLVGAQQSR